MDAVKDVCYHLPFWAVPVIASLGAFGANRLCWKVIEPFRQQAGESLDHYPFYAGGIVFLLLILAGTTGWFERRKHKRTLAETNSLERLRALSWREFEHLVAEAYRAAGWQVRTGPGNAADGGIDIEARSPSGARVLIQCKHWKRQKIDVKIVREMLGVLTREGTDKVIVIGTGSFTKDAIQWAEGQPIQLVDGPSLLKHLQQFQGGTGVQIGTSTFSNVWLY